MSKAEHSSERETTMRNPTRFKDELPPLFPDKCYSDFRMFCHLKFEEHCMELKQWEKVQTILDETAWILGNKWYLKWMFQNDN